MIQVKNNSTGNIETLESDKDLPEMVSSGAISIPSKEYEFESPEGDKYKVGAQGFLDAVKQGWKFRDQDTIKQEELEKKYGDSTAKALLYGGLRGASLGLSDVALTKMGMVDQEELSAIKEFNPIASNVAEIGATVAPVLLSGGTGGAAAISKKLLPTLLEEGAEYVGKRAAANITSQVAKKAIEIGAAGAVEGAVMGVSQTISEAALGDAEFNAESLLANVGTGALVGGGLGSTLGASLEYTKKASRFAKSKVVDQVVSQVDGDEAFKAEVRKKLADDNAIEEALKAVKDPEIQKLKELYPDAPTTRGMESVYKPVKQAEDYLFDAPTVAGEEIRKKSSELKDYVDKNVNEIWQGARDATPEETGDLIKKTLFNNINEGRDKGKAFYNSMMEEFGDAAVATEHRKNLVKIITSSDAYRIGKEGADIKRVLGILDDGEALTLKQIKELEQDIGASAKMAKGSERRLLNEARENLRGMQDSIIRDTVGDSEAAKKVIAGLDAANADYKRAYAAKEEIADIFGIKGKDFDDVLEKIDGTSALDLEKNFLNIKKSDKAFEVLQKYPEIGKLVLANRQKALLSKHMLQGGEINYSGLKKTLLKMNPEERALYFGGNKAQEKKLIDMLTLYEKRPKTLNPSGTDIRNEVRNLLNPKQMMQNWALSEIYRGDDSTIGKFVGKVLPTLGAIEKSANKQKNKIAGSVNGFFNAAGAGVTIGTLEMLSDRDMNKAKKSYELVQNNPEALLNKYLENNKTLTEVAPQTSNALQQRIIAGVQFLQTKVPHRDQDYLGEKLEPSKSEIMRFNDYLEAVEKPQIIYDQLKQGYLNPNTLETLRVVYPRTYEAIQAEMIAKLPKKLSRAQKIQLQPILGSRVTPAMDYQNLMVLQGKTQGSAQAQAQADAQINHVPMTAASKMKVSDRSQTGLAKTLNRT